MATTTSTEVARVTNVAIQPGDRRSRALPLSPRGRLSGESEPESAALSRQDDRAPHLHARLSRRRRSVGSRRHAADRLGVAGRDARLAPEQRARAVLPRRQSDGGVRAVTDSRGAAPGARVPRHGREASSRRSICRRFDLASTVFCLLLPRGVVLVDGVSTGHNGVDSEHGLGGYHGSIHAKTQDDLLRGRRLLGGHERHQRLPRRLEEHVRRLLPRAVRGENRSGRRGRDPRRQLTARRRLPRVVLAARRRDRRHPARGSGREPDVGDEGGEARERRQDGARPADVVERGRGTGGADRPQARIGSDATWSRDRDPLARLRRARPPEPRRLPRLPRRGARRRTARDGRRLQRVAERRRPRVDRLPARDRARRARDRRPHADRRGRPLERPLRANDLDTRRRARRRGGGRARRVGSRDAPLARDHPEERERRRAERLGLAGVDAERRIFGRQQRGVGEHAQRPAVEPEHEVEDRAGILAAEEQHEARDEDEQVDDPEREWGPAGVVAAKETPAPAKTPAIT